MAVTIDYAKIGTRIRMLRREHNMTQEELAHRCDYSASQISAVENGDRAPSFDLMLLIADTFHVTLDFFISDTPYVNTQYFINSRLAPKLASCSTQELLLVERFIDEMLCYKESIISSQ